MKKISVIYNPINQNNTFTSGDFISGQVILDVVKETKMQSLSVLIKGKAKVSWAQRYGQNAVVYKDKEKYYSMEKSFVQKDKKHGDDHEMLKDPSGQPYSSVVARGRHVYPFTFQLPLQHFPPTFKGSLGNIVYTLETKLSRSMRVSSKAKAEFHYVSSHILVSPGLMAPQYGSKEKKIKLFPSGTISMDIQIEKMGYYPGEELKVSVEVQNNSSRTIKPKFRLYENHSFFAKGKGKLVRCVLLKEKGETIEPNSKNTVTKVLPIPPSLPISILNCRILKVEYSLGVYLDVPHASNPEISFPVVVLPLQSVPGTKSASDFGFWNQPPGGNVNSSPPPMLPSAPPGQLGASGYTGPPLSPFPAPGCSGLPAQFAPLVTLDPNPVPHQSDSSAPPPYQE